MIRTNIFGGTSVSLPVPTYTGEMLFTPLGETKGYAKLLTSGTLTFPKSLPVDVFLVGGGGGGVIAGGGGGYTKTFKQSNTGWKDGNAPFVLAGIPIEIIVGLGGSAPASGVATPIQGGFSQFWNSEYRADGGYSATQVGTTYTGGNGGSGGGTYASGNGGANGSDGFPSANGLRGRGQGHTTREFGEAGGQLFAGGGGAVDAGIGGEGGGGNGTTGPSSYNTSGKTNTGGGAGGTYNASQGGIGGSGIVIIRWGSGWVEG